MELSNKYLKKQENKFDKIFEGSYKQMTWSHMLG